MLITELPLPRMMGGIPTLNAGLYRSIRFLVGDPVVYIEWPQADGSMRSTLICRDIEMGRARVNANVNQVNCPADFTPSQGLSGDRETATAQAAAEAFCRAGFKRVVVDRSLPMIYTSMLQKAGIAVECDLQWGVMERRMKNEAELKMIREAQRITEEVMEKACSTLARCSVDAKGVLQHDGAAMTDRGGLPRPWTRSTLYRPADHRRYFPKGQSDSLQRRLHSNCGQWADSPRRRTHACGGRCSQSSSDRSNPCRGYRSRGSRSDHPIDRRVWLPDGTTRA